MNQLLHEYIYKIFSQMSHFMEILIIKCYQHQRFYTFCWNWALSCNSMGLSERQPPPVSCLWM